MVPSPATRSDARLLSLCGWHDECDRKHCNHKNLDRASHISTQDMAEQKARASATIACVTARYPLKPSG